MSQVSKEKNHDQSFVAYCVAVVSLFWKSTVFWTTDAVKKIGRTAKDYQIRSFLETMIMQIYQDYLEQIVYQGEFEKGTMIEANLDEASKAVIENIIALEAKNGNEEAIELLVAFSAFGENKLQELSRETLVQISSEENVREIVSKTLYHWLLDDQDPSLIHVFAKVNEKKAVEKVCFWSMSGNEEQRKQSLIFASENTEMMKYHLQEIINNLNRCHFWENEDNQDNHSCRLMYYKIVHALFAIGGISSEYAIKKLALVYRHEKSISNTEYLIEMIEKISNNDGISNISEFLIIFFTVNPSFHLREEILVNHLEELLPEKKIYLLESIILKTPHLRVVYSCLRLYFEISQSEQRESFLKTAVTTAKNVGAVSSYLFDVIEEENEIKKYHELMLDTATNINSLEQLICYLKAYSFQGDENLISALLDSVEVVLENTKDISKDDYHTVLSCLLVISRSKPKFQEKIFSMIQSEMEKSKKVFDLLFEDIYETFATCVSWGEHKIGKEAGEFLKTLKPSLVIPELQKLFEKDFGFMRYRQEANLGAISILTSFAINGSVQSLDILGNMKSCQTINADSIPKALLNIHKKAEEKTFRSLVLKHVSRRFQLACGTAIYSQGKSMPSAFAELESIEALKCFKSIRKGYLSGLSLIHTSDHPMPGFATIIEEIDEIIPESEMNEAKNVLRDLALNLGKKINQLKKERDSKEKISACTRIISAITKKIQ